jgi:shikimate kinase
MSHTRQLRNLALIGFMGTGKSTVGRLVARQLGLSFMDTDDRIEQMAGKTIPRIFAEDGEAAFRAIERRVVTELVRLRDTVIATGGGLGANLDHLASLKTHALVVCLWATPDVIWSRVRRAPRRPLLQVPDPLGRIRELLAERTPAYRQADVLVYSGLRQLREVAWHVTEQFQRARQTSAPR